MHEVLKGWAQDVERVTESRVDIEFAAGSLAPPPQQRQGVASGVFDVAFAINPTIKSKAPLLEISSLPWLVSDAGAASVAAWRTYEKHFAAKNQFPDVQLLSVFNFSGGQLYSTTDTPINSVDELKKRKMWARCASACRNSIRAGSSAPSCSAPPRSRRCWSSTPSTPSTSASSPRCSSSRSDESSPWSRCS